MNSTLLYIENQLRSYVDENELRDVALWIVEEATGLTRPEILCKDTTFIPNLEIILQRVRQAEPLQYIFGRTYWGGLELEVNADTLIPRPETWGIIETIERFYSACSQLKILDVGTGSGCIAIILKKKFPKAEVYACDINAHAVETAKNNASLNGVEIQTFVCDILSDTDCSRFKDLRFDIVVSNPPYVMQSEKQTMSKRVLNYEPARALFVPDNDPLIFYRRIATLFYPTPLYFEINEQCAQEMRDMLQGVGYANIEVLKDIYNKDRIVVAEIK